MSLTHKKCDLHKEVMIKINSLIDKNIVPLVQALNDFNCIITLDSCQGGDDRPAYIYFVFRGEQRKEAMFFFWLASALRQKAEQDYELNLSWIFKNENALAKLVTQPEYIDSLSKSLKKIAKAYRKNGFGDDK